MEKESESSNKENVPPHNNKNESNSVAGSCSCYADSGDCSVSMNDMYSSSDEDLSVPIPPLPAPPVPSSSTPSAPVPSALPTITTADRLDEIESNLYQIKSSFIAQHVLIELLFNSNTYPQRIKFRNTVITIKADHAGEFAEAELQAMQNLSTTMSEDYNRFLTNDF